MPNDVQMAKANVRVQMVDKRALLHAEERMAASVSIVDQIAKSDVFQGADSYCAFVPTREEVQIRELTDLAVRNGCAVHFPAFDADSRIYRFRAWDPATPLRAGRWNILEPQGEAFSVPAGKVCIIVPGLAFDRKGWRVGYGGGYFDRMLRETRSLAGSHATAIGVAYAFQIIEGVPHDAQDEPVDFVVTESEWIQTKGE